MGFSREEWVIFRFWRPLNLSIGEGGGQQFMEFD